MHLGNPARLGMCYRNPRHGDPLPSFYGRRGYSQELYSSGCFRGCANPVCTEVSGCYSGLKEVSEVGLKEERNSIYLIKIKQALSPWAFEHHRGMMAAGSPMEKAIVHGFWN